MANYDDLLVEDLVIQFTHEKPKSTFTYNEDADNVLLQCIPVDIDEAGVSQASAIRTFKRVN